VLLATQVIRVERASAVGQNQKFQVLNRGRKSVSVDLKDPAGVEFVLRLCETADGLVEGFRPGVTEKLGLGPDVVLERNPKLVYGRMTGWGQDGPMAPAVRLSAVRPRAVAEAAARCLSSSQSHSTTWRCAAR
jgi:alpha-methylacyl-CoA racemase